MAERSSVLENQVLLRKLHEPRPPTDAGAKSFLADLATQSLDEISDPLDATIPRVVSDLGFKTGVHVVVTMPAVVETWYCEIHRRFWIRQENPFGTESGFECLRSDIPQFIRGRHRIFVREEYNKIWDHIRDHVCVDSSSLVVVGQSGIGKTCFLRWALLKALLARMPVVFSLIPGHFVVFDVAGVREVTAQQLADLPPNVLGLFDTTSGIERCLVCIETKPAVICWSPQLEHFERVRNHLDAECWEMEPWTKEESALIPRVGKPHMSEKALAVSLNRRMKKP
ncbi:uncharacterized protein BXZ73DRAFT_101737 [Epithele typhae]|uniref:uncharacterized protein n=1 Tax=Epithele typhae TaxID=378194 RepID=UPI0020080389|nr:uncharacterized protein BXZ73DRAFT_101737 [Epithele typhae]KAH9931155.1 hypothetical protein BXZ73DRAFT_101737 [Epithele typhae]